jgi:arsenical pump membrane protein
LPHLAAALIWTISLGSILLMLARPRGIAEAWWIGAGALLLVLTGLLPLAGAAHAIHEGLDVYLFLIGMMLLAETARYEGVFDWVAGVAVSHARGSAARLFLLIYVAGTIVTIFLSNVLPISNPANLVIFDARMPPLATWLRIFLLPSVASILATYFILYLLSRQQFAETVADTSHVFPPAAAGKAALAGIIIAALVLLLASGLGWQLGAPTCAVGVLAVLMVTLRDRRAAFIVVRGVSWSIIPLVAGLFMIVEALNRGGMLHLAERGLRWTAGLSVLAGKLAAGFAVGLLSNGMNNLPVGLASGSALRHAQMSGAIQHAVLVGVDLGPNLSVTGSLATILWLIALRREGVEISGWEFLKAGMIAMPIALLASLLALF